jgi:hypothetical protein
MFALAIPPVVGPLPPVVTEVVAPAGVAGESPALAEPVEPPKAGKFAGESPASNPPPSHMSRMMVPTNPAASAPRTSAISSVIVVSFLTRLAL